MTKHTYKINPSELKKGDTTSVLHNGTLLYLTITGVITQGACEPLRSQIFHHDWSLLNNRFCLLINNETFRAHIGCAKVFGNGRVSVFCPVSKLLVEIDGDQNYSIFNISQRSGRQLMPRFESGTSRLEQNVMSKAHRICKKKRVPFCPSPISEPIRRTSSTVTRIVNDCISWRDAYAEDDLDDDF